MAWFTESVAGGLRLVVLGTDGGDAITVSRSSGMTLVITSGGTYTLADTFSEVQVFGFGGDDVLVSISGGAEAIWGGAGLDSFWSDSLDTLVDIEGAETTGKSVHVVSEFYQPTVNASEYVSLELAGQDLIDPTAAQGYYDYSSNPLFVDTPTYDDVDQGNVADCYYLAALGSLADSDPGIIQQMIAPMGDGTYAVRFYRGGEEIYVRVDGELPAYYGVFLANAKLTPDGELWVAIAEKAYAQFRTDSNSYASIAYGWMDDVYEQVTGTSAMRTSTSGMSDNALVTTISDAIQNGQAVSAATDSSAGGPIVQRHAYTVQSVESVNGQWMVTVYNVWGQDGKTWDSNQDDGLLTISLDMFQQNFSSLCISSA